MKLIMVILAVSMLLIISGCVKSQTFSKEDKIYNPPVTRGDEKQNPSAIVNESLGENKEIGYCSETSLPKNF